MRFIASRIEISADAAQDLAPGELKTPPAQDQNPLERLVRDDLLENKVL